MDKTIIEKELLSVGHFWLDRAIDSRNGGFFGEIDSSGNIIENSDKGAILHFRGLWFFSEMGIYDGNIRYKVAAESLYHFIEEHFTDSEHEGTFWSIHPDGSASNMRKQTFSQAFYLYGLVAFYRLTKNPVVLEKAKGLYQLIEKKSYQSASGYHIAAFNRYWIPLAHMESGESDIHVVYNLDTELHIMEAYTELYRVAPSETLAQSIRKSLQTFEKGFFNEKNGYFRTNLDENLFSQTSIRLFGHNAECAWLIEESLSVLGDKDLRNRWVPRLLQMLEKAVHFGTDSSGRFYEGIDLETGEQMTDSIWWIQCEAWIGMYTGYRISGEQKWLDRAESIGRYLLENHADSDVGEWQWFSKKNRKAGKDAGIVNEWKGPYHNGRAMLKAYTFAQ